VYWRALLIVGVMGGLTTWSALMLESLLYLRSGRSSTLLLYFLTTLVGGLLLVWAGARLGEMLRG
jgi:CrcB protein